MNSACYRFSLSMQSYQSQVSLPVLLGDTARVLLIKFVDNGKPYYINDGCRAVFFAEKPDGNVLINDCIIENNARIRYEFTAQTATASGISKCEIRLYGANGRLITSPKFIMVIDEKVVYDDEVLASYSEFTTLDGIIATEITRVEAEEERVRAENNRSMEFDTAMQNIAAEALASIPTLSVDKKGNTATVTVETKEGETNSVTITDGTPCTHEWNGTNLTVTSASGTSSADLKGDPGDSGISNIGTEYYVSTSDTSLTGGEWISEIPNDVAGKYLWIRIVTVYDNGRVSYSAPVRDPICERITTHESNTNNPHGVTASQIGAVPAVESTNYSGCYYRTVNGVTEWINPPMTEGVAYRTTERYLGKAVYTMLIDCGNLPNATSKNVSTGVSIATHTFIDLKVFAEWTSGTTAMKSAFPIINTADGIVARAQFSSSSIQIVTTTDRSTTTAYAVIKYVEK